MDRLLPLSEAMRRACHFTFTGEPESSGHVLVEHNGAGKVLYLGGILGAAVRKHLYRHEGLRGAECSVSWQGNRPDIWIRAPKKQQGAENGTQ